MLIKIDEQNLTNKIQLEKEVRQGEPQTQKTFTLVLENALKINLNTTEPSSHPLFHNLTDSAVWNCNHLLFIYVIHILKRVSK